MFSLQSGKSTTRMCVETCLVNHRLKLVYAYVPKAACTSIKTWLVRQAGFAPELAAALQSAEKSGLRPTDAGYPNVHDHLDQHYSLRVAPAQEVAAIMADPSYFKFAFVRHPLARLVSAYLDKVVRVKGPARRIIRNYQFWNGHLRWADVANWFSKQGGLNAARSLSFREFITQLRRENSELMNAHFRAQTRLLRELPLDFIGRIENSDADFRRVQEHLGVSHPLSNRNIREHAAEPDGETAADWEAARFRSGASAPPWQHFFDRPLWQQASELYAADFTRFGYEALPVPQRRLAATPEPRTRLAAQA